MKTMTAKIMITSKAILGVEKKNVLPEKTFF